MKLNKEQFLKTEFGGELECTITAWDKALEMQWLHDYASEEYKEGMKDALWCQAQWEVYQMAIKHFYGVEYHFTRTDEYFGLCTEDESDFLMKVDRGLTSCSKPAPDTETDIDRVVKTFTQGVREYLSELNG